MFGGVASCDTKAGMQVCRDGTYSKSCVCEKQEEQNRPGKNEDHMNKY